jgi:deoxyribodipyrimidine photo-lyase
LSGSELPGDRSVAIWWVRRDLRVSDNRALAAALRRSERVVPLFIVDPLLMDQPAPLRKGFLWDGLRQLAAGLRVLGSRLIVRRGEPVDVLAQVVSETGAEVVFAEEDYAPYAQARDARAVARLPAHFVSGPTLRHPLDVLKAAGTPYTVFTPYSRAWSALAPPGVDDLLPAPRRLPPVSDSLFSIEFADDIAPDDFPAGEREARQRLESFTAGTSPPIWEYAHTRDRLDLPGTSTLSPYLRFGMLSARQAIVATRQAMDRAPDQRARAGAASWLSELIWREFYHAVLYHYPDVLEQAFRPTLRHVPWDNNRTAFDAWCAGETGYPVVDAAMRQLRQTGWMHNRARMIVASFLVKDLLIDWQWGERWFMEWLVDGDPAANNGGWQWTAGVGTDAAPYFRIFNPVLQGKKFDPYGDYVRQWLPELARVPAPYLHEPWRMPPREQHDAACVIGRDYPPPLVDHAWARERTLAAYKSAR